MQTTGEASFRWAGAAVCWLIGFVAPLRPREMSNLLRCHVVLPADILDFDEFRRCAVLTIETPQSRSHAGRCQFSIVEDDDVVAWLQRWLDRIGPREPLFPGSMQMLGHMFKQVGRIIRVSGASTLASLRTGGATSHFRRHRHLQRLQFAERRKSQSTFVHDLQEAMSVHMWLQMNDNARAAVLGAAQQRGSPPASPWYQVLPHDTPAQRRTHGRRRAGFALEGWEWLGLTFR